MPSSQFGNKRLSLEFCSLAYQPIPDHGPHCLCFGVLCAHKTTPNEIEIAPGKHLVIPWEDVNANSGLELGIYVDTDHRPTQL